MSVRRGMVIEAEDGKHHLTLTVYITSGSRGYQGRAVLRKSSSVLYFGPTLAVGKAQYACLKILDQLKFQHLLPFFDVVGIGLTPTIEHLFDELAQAVIHRGE